MGVVLCPYVVSAVVECGWMEAGRQRCREGAGRERSKTG